MPARRLRSSMARWESVPLPDDECVSLSGFAFAYATSSGSVFAGTDGWTTRSSGRSATSAIGSKSLSVS